MANYPLPKGYGGGSGKDGDIVRTGTGGRLSNNLEDPKAPFDDDSRRNPSDLSTLPGEHF